MAAADRYQLVGMLGEGGSAEVFEAAALGEHGFERRVAIKRLRAEHVEETIFLRSFIDEARIASQLHHANIVAVLDFGMMDNMPFQVIELVEGLDARRLLDSIAPRPGLPPDLALYISLQVAQALAYAHDASGGDGVPLGIIHRDVKPQNVLISWTGDVKLADFGIAYAKKRLGETVAGYAKGTARFMSPEQALGGDLDKRSDVFSLGCLLYTLVTGGSPVADEHVRLRMLEGVPLPLSESVPEDLRAIVARATRFHRTERYDGADVMASELSRALAKRPGEDPRSRLRQFLSPMYPGKKAAAPVKKAGADLLDIEVVLGVPDGGGVRRFSSVIAPEPIEELSVATMVEEQTSPGEEPTPVIMRATWEHAQRPHSTPHPASMPQYAPSPVIEIRRGFPWRWAAWAVLVLVGTANLTVMMLQREGSVEVRSKPEVVIPTVHARSTEQARPQAAKVERAEELVEPAPSEEKEVPDKLPGPAAAGVASARKKVRVSKKTEPPAEPPTRPAVVAAVEDPTPDAEQLRANLAVLRARIEKLAARASAADLAALEGSFLDLSTREVRAENEADRKRIHHGARALAARISALESSLEPRGN